MMNEFKMNDGCKFNRSEGITVEGFIWAYQQNRVVREGFYTGQFNTVVLPDDIMFIYEHADEGVSVGEISYTDLDDIYTMPVYTKVMKDNTRVRVISECGWDAYLEGTEYCEIEADIIDPSEYCKQFVKAFNQCVTNKQMIITKAYLVTMNPQHFTNVLELMYDIENDK